MKKLIFSILFGMLTSLSGLLDCASCDIIGTGTRPVRCLDDIVTVTPINVSSCKKNSGIIRITVTSAHGNLTVTTLLVGPLESPTPHQPINFTVQAGSSETRDFTGLSNGTYTVITTVTDSDGNSTCITTCGSVIVNNKVRKCPPLIFYCCR